VSDPRQTIIAVTEKWLEGEDKPLPSFIEDLADQLVAAGLGFVAPGTAAYELEQTRAELEHWRELARLGGWSK
jgi:hypothetical protein